MFVAQSLGFWLAVAAPLFRPIQYCHQYILVSNTRLDIGFHPYTRLTSHELHLAPTIGDGHFAPNRPDVLGQFNR